jgi:hypothetical protein
MKELAGEKCMENDCFLRTLKFEMRLFQGQVENKQSNQEVGPLVGSNRQQVAAQDKHEKSKVVLGFLR